MSGPQWTTGLELDGQDYILDDESPHSVEEVEVQAGDALDQPFTVRIENWAFGWGASKFMEPGHYDYSDGALLHKRLSFLPGALVVEYTPVTPPIGPVSFCEYWDGTDANRRLIVVSPRHIYEITPAGTVTTNDLDSISTGNFTTAKPVTEGVRFKNGGMSTVQMYFAHKGTSAEEFITRTAANTYIGSASNKHAKALGVGQDDTGATVLWRITENNKINQCVADADPENAGSWAGAEYDVGDVSVEANDMIQQSRRMLVCRPDGVYSFDNRGRSIPLTPGMEAVKDARNGYNAKDFNGAAVIPTIAGLIMIDGLDWQAIGPVSANTDARSLRGRETAFSGMCGEYCYAAVLVGADSYIYMGTMRTEGKQGSGVGPVIWHGPIAKLEGVEVTDLAPSTVWGKKLWIGFTDGFGAIALNADFSPTASDTAGSIYFPEGVLDRAGAEVLKEIHSVEYIAPAANVLDANNTWTAYVDVGSGWETPGAGNSGAYQKRSFSTQKASHRPLLKLDFSGDGTGELEAIVVSGRSRPVTALRHKFRIITFHGMRKANGARIWKSPEELEDLLRALTGWETVVRWGQTSFTGIVVDVSEIEHAPSRFQKPTRVFEVAIDEVP